MAGDWIKIRTDLSDDPDVYLLSEYLSLECPTIVGHLVMFWGWMDRHTHDGQGIKLSQNIIDRKIGCEGFTAALLKIGWLEGVEHDYSLSKFERHNGNSGKARALEAEAKRLRRADKTPPPGPPTVTPPPKTNVGQVSDKPPKKSPTRGEERREEKSKDIKDSGKRFSPPSQQEILDYFVFKKSPDAVNQSNRFFYHYESNGWKTGKNKMKSWQAAINYWMTNSRPSPKSAAPSTRDISLEQELSDTSWADTPIAPQQTGIELQ